VNGAQAEGAVGQGDLTGRVDGAHRVLVRQADQALQRGDALDAAPAPWPWPAAGLGADVLGLLQQPRRPALDTAPGSRYYLQAQEAHRLGKPFAQFQAETVAAEKAREEAAARAAEATRKAQLAAAQRAEKMRQQQPGPRQPYRSSYTPTWDGSFSKHAMDSWSKLNQQSQQSMNRFYQQQYKQGFRNTPW
jgi:hypothetical protein